RVRRARHDLRWLGRHLPHGVGAYHRPAPEVHGPRPYRVRFGLALVWRSPVADRRLLAVPDPRGDPGAVGLPGAHRGQPAQDPRPQLGGAVQATRGERGVGPRGLQTRASELRVADPQFAADAPRVSWAGQRRLFEDEEAVRRDGRRAKQYPLRLAPNESVGRNPAHRAGREALRPSQPPLNPGGAATPLTRGYARRQRPRPASRRSRGASPGGAGDGAERAHGMT